MFSWSSRFFRVKHFPKSAKSVLGQILNIFLTVWRGQTESLKQLCGFDAKPCLLWCYCLFALTEAENLSCWQMYDYNFTVRGAGEVPRALTRANSGTHCSSSRTWQHFDCYVTSTALILICCDLWWVQEHPNWHTYQLDASCLRTVDHYKCV